MSGAQLASPGRPRTRVTADTAIRFPGECRISGSGVFSPLVVFQEGDRYWLAEGFHRLAAGLHAGLGELPFEVRQGGLRDAILHSVGSNATHGLRRTNADKRRAVSILRQDELVAVDPATGDPWSDQEVSRRCAVSPTFVGTMRRSLSTVDSEPITRAYRDRHGNVTQMDTARIGRRPADPTPDLLPQPEAPEASSPADDAGNVVVLGNRFTIMPAPGAVKRDHFADQSP